MDEPKPINRLNNGPAKQPVNAIRPSPILARALFANRSEFLFYNKYVITAN